MMQTFESDIIYGKQFIFELSFQNFKDKDLKILSLKIFRTDKRFKNQSIDDFQVNVDYPFELSFPDKINAKGVLGIFANSNKYYIWGNFNYGVAFENHFEGAMIEIPNEYII